MHMRASLTTSSFVVVVVVFVVVVVVLVANQEMEDKKSLLGSISPTPRTTLYSYTTASWPLADFYINAWACRHIS